MAGSGTVGNEEGEMREDGGVDGTIGVVAIGRNEGKRLRRCLESVVRFSSLVVYVDSGSTDGSVELARSMRVEVVPLDMRVPFSAARARNEGFARLVELSRELEYVLFVDGDCEVVEGWLKKAARFLDERPDVAVACGRRRERYPERSVYNMLCDIEWDTPVGEARSCGGDAVMRVVAFERVGGYRSDLIAGEEPELCVRMRAAGWRIWRLNEEMTLHDAGMTSFGQWWRRSMRTGYAFSQGVDLHGAPPERHAVREARSAWIWGCGIPAVILGLAFCWGAGALVLFLVYPSQVARLALRGGRTARENWWRASFVVLGKFPELLGKMKFLRHRFLGGKIRLIEYK